jgi:predicted nucleic acid-binding protein
MSSWRWFGQSTTTTVRLCGTRQGNLPARLCTDVHLAALAMANGWRLVSFDQDFKRFNGLDLLSL